MKKPKGFVGLIITTFLFLVFFFRVLPVSLSFAGEEKDKRHLFLGDSNYAPYEYLEYGKPTGLVVDLMAAIEEETGLAIDIELMNWAKAQEQVKT